MHSFFQKDVDTKMLTPRTSVEKYWDRKYYLPKFGETSEILKERWFKEDAEEFLDAIEISSADDIENPDEKKVPDVNGSAKRNYELEFIPFEKKTSSMETSNESDPGTGTENVSERTDEDSNILRKVLRSDIKLRLDKVKVDLKKLCAISNEKDPNEYIFEELCHCLNTNANVFYDSLLKALFAHTGSELKLYKKQINDVFKKMEWAHRKFYNIKFERLSERFKKYLYYNSNVDFNMQKWTKMSRRLSHLKLYAHEVDSKKILLGNLRECVVEISGSPHMLLIKCIRDSIILCGPIESSIYIELCYDCVFLIAGKQLRIKYSSNCNIYSQIRNIIAIEACNELSFGKYNLFYRNIEKDFAKAGMVFNDDYTGKIVDANWPNKTPSPHWTVLDSGVAALTWFEYKQNLLAKICKAEEEKKVKVEEIIPDLKSLQIVDKEKSDKEKNDKEMNDKKKHDKKNKDEKKNDTEKNEKEINDKKNDEKNDNEKNEKEKNDKKNDDEKNDEEKNDEGKNDEEKNKKKKNDEEKNDNEQKDNEMNDKDKKETKKNDEKKIDEQKNDKEKNDKKKNDKKKNGKKKNEKDKNEEKMNDKEKNDINKNDEKMIDEKKNDKEKNDMLKNDKKKNDKDKNDKDKNDKERNDKKKNDKEKNDMEKNDKKENDVDKNDKEKNDKKKNDNEKNNKKKNEKEKNDKKKNEKAKNDKKKNDKEKDDKRKKTVEETMF